MFWQSIKDSKKAGDYKAYLAQFPNGTFAGLARSRLAALKPAKVASPKPPTSTPKIPTRTTAATQETLFWQSIKGSTNPADYQDYLMAFPKGTFARLARRRINELNRKKVAVARPSRPTRSRRIEKLRGYHIWVQTTNKQRGLTYCRQLKEAGLIVYCWAGRGSISDDNIMLKCSTLPSDTGEIIQEFLGAGKLRVWDWRKHKDYGAKVCGKYHAITIQTIN